MFDGNGGSGGDGDVRDDDGAHAVGPQEPQIPDSLAPSPDWAAQMGLGRAEGATEEKTGGV